MFGKRVVKYPHADLQHLRMVFQTAAKTLQRAEVIGVADLIAQGCVKTPVTFALVGPETLQQLSTEVGGKAVVVEQRVVHVEQKHRGRSGRLQHGLLVSATGSCQPSALVTMRLAVAGPQLPRP